MQDFLTGLISCEFIFVVAVTLTGNPRLDRETRTFIIYSWALGSRRSANKSHATGIKLVSLYLYKE